MRHSSHNLFLLEMLRFALLLAALASPGSLFNLDTSSAIVKVGPPNSLFGYAIAFHQQSTSSDPILLVGAPKAISEDRRSFGIPTGAIYSCPTEQTCRPIKMEFIYNAQKENITEQWLGVVVRSAGVGGKVLACAHRYQLVRALNNVAETRSIVGRCVLLSATLKPDIYDTDSGRIVHVKSISRDTIELGGEDGPYETGDEKKRNDNDINVKQNSYLGKIIIVLLKTTLVISVTVQQVCVLQRI
uniref:Uncharacterized protein n=1 Tax=Eptatretus burgeri TaxID=7764 RepID=A0A8C4NND4_EPTBU